MPGKRAMLLSSFSVSFLRGGFYVSGPRAGVRFHIAFSTRYAREINNQRGPIPFERPNRRGESI